MIVDPKLLIQLRCIYVEAHSHRGVEGNLEGLSTLGLGYDVKLDHPLSKTVGQTMESPHVPWCLLP